MDLAQCAAILEAAGWTVDLWDTIMTPTATQEEVQKRVRAEAPDLLLVRPLAHTSETTVLLCKSLAEQEILCLAMGPSGPHRAAQLLTPIDGVAPTRGVLVGESADASGRLSST